MRSCIGCRAVNPKEKLLRFVLTPQGELALDYNLKLPGRGCYLCPDISCIKKAFKGNAFQRAFKSQVEKMSVEDIASVICKKAMEKIASCLLFAKKAGKLALGTMSVEKEIKKGALSSVLTLSDMSESSSSDIEKKAEREGIPFYKLLYAENIGLIIGNKKVVGMKDAGLSDSVVREIKILGNVMAGLN